MQFAITSQDNDVTRVELSGRVTQRDISPFDDPLGDLIGAGCYGQRVLLGMQDVEILDSSGVSYLLTCQKRFRQAGGTLVLHSVSPIAASVLKVLNLHQVFEIAADVSSALQLAAGDTR